MMLPVAGTNLGRATGGGLLDSLTGGSAKQDDGSVGLFDGVLMKAGIGSMIGAGLGMVLPVGGPIIGGLIGSLAGAALGVFQNYRKIKAIREENAAYIAAMGVQPETQEQAAALLSGNVNQLMPTQQTGQTAQQTTQQTTQQQLPATTDPALQSTQQSIQQPATSQVSTADPFAGGLMMGSDTAFDTSMKISYTGVGGGAGAVEQTTQQGDPADVWVEGINPKQTTQTDEDPPPTQQAPPTPVDVPEQSVTPKQAGTAEQGGEVAQKGGEPEQEPVQQNADQALDTALQERRQRRLERFAQFEARVAQLMAQHRAELEAACAAPKAA